MAHFSRDEQLCQILREDGDPFLLIAAAWHDVKPEEVQEAHDLTLASPRMLSDLTQRLVCLVRDLVHIVPGVGGFQK